MNEIIKLIFEKGNDPIWRLNNLYCIVDKDANKIHFTPNEIQKIINRSKAKRKIVLKSRQFGVSTNELIKLLDWTMFTENATAGILAHDQDAIRKLFRIVRRAYEFMPDPLKPRLDRGGGSMYEMFFPDIGSRIYCDLEIRGDTVGRLHVSEAAFMKDSSALKASLQAVPISNGHVTIETTPNGMANFFYDMWADPDSIYEKLFFPWYLFSQYQIKTSSNLEYTEEENILIKKAKNLYGIDITKEQIAFRRFKKSEMKRSDYDQSRVVFEQEYPEDDKSCFLSSGASPLDLEVLNRYISEAHDPLRIENGIRIYKEKEPNTDYVCAADPSEGVGRDSSAAVVMKAETMEIVSVFKGNLKPSAFAFKLSEMCNLYKFPSRYPPLLAVERNNHGHAVLLQLNEVIGYSNLYMHHDEKLGWRSDGISRPKMMDKFVEAFDSMHLKIPDKDILSECLTLINNNGKIEAASGKHDDLIIACAIALQIKPDASSSIFDVESRIKL